ncbi:hypothetical protein [Ornithinimicrobium kibberense]|uniref:hypothetical protein n=1 Tax=Ornithinimicrobium kibberense TaxID=282060 RepID=UPI003621DA9C
MPPCGSPSPSGGTHESTLRTRPCGRVCSGRAAPPAGRSSERCETGLPSRTSHAERRGTWRTPTRLSSQSGPTLSCRPGPSGRRRTRGRATFRRR